ncbi:hypothetical protein ONZ45_g8953 [Pleurotus djamor]|nr:hypothetical protein ONZ45_g8953 [Pleurotus djamor]
MPHTSVLLFNVHTGTRVHVRLSGLLKNITIKLFDDRIAVAGVKADMALVVNSYTLPDAITSEVVNTSEAWTTLPNLGPPKLSFDPMPVLAQAEYYAASELSRSGDWTLLCIDSKVDVLRHAGEFVARCPPHPPSSLSSPSSHHLISLPVQKYTFNTPPPYASRTLMYRTSATQCRLQVHNVQTPNDPSIPSPAPLPGNNTSPSSENGNGTTTSSPTSPQWTPFNYGRDTIRGVNLGGWLVLEPWITPSLFENANNTDVVDEYTFGQLLDHDTALTMLTHHWETWITEDDFIAIRAAGLNHVRIPVGYWSVPITSSDTQFNTSPSPYIPGAWPYLLRALNWARDHGIHVILDLHGAPGSQNGYDNSGQRTSSPQWATSSNNVARTVDILKFMATTIGGMVDVIELLNEPAGFLPSVAAVIRDFWLNGYVAVRDAAGEDIKVMIGDAFLTVGNWQGFLTAPQGQGVLMDYHEYQIFSKDELARSWDDHIAFACTYIPTLSDFARSNIWTVIGEWSNAPTDCAKWLNGRGRGARWDGSFTTDPSDTRVFGTCANMTGSWEGWEDKYKTFLRRYWEVQVEIGENIQGWIFWTWKAEQADEWSYQKGLEGGWIPRDPTDRMYPNICS